jgi:hypothetical protein
VTSKFPTWAVDGPLPIPPVHGLLQAAAAPAAGVRIVVDTTLGPADENSIAPQDAGLEAGLYRKPDGTIWLRQLGGDQQVFTPQNAGRERWLNGIAVYPYPVEAPEVWDACATGSSEGEKSFGTAIVPAEFAALTISEAITCTSQQVPDQDAFKARAVAVLAATESYAVANALLTGSGISGQPYLADSYCSFPNGTVATRPNHGLQVLEEQVALTGRLGLIHCSPMLATALLGSGFVIKDRTGVIRTINGIVVIPDFGYAEGATPAAAPAPTATQEWAFATGPIDIRRSEIFTSPDTLTEALDRGVANAATNNRPNTVTYRAERYYVTSCDLSLQAAVLIDRCGDTCEVGS